MRVRSNAILEPMKSVLFALIALYLAPSIEVAAQTIGPDSDSDRPEAPEAVVIVPEATDEAIAARLQQILEATGWYQSPQVSVNQGVVFLAGKAARADHRLWAGDLSRRAQDVVAVVNRIEVVDGPAWDVTPALESLQLLAVTVLRSIPYVLFSLGLLILAAYLATLMTRLLRRLLRGRRINALLRDVFARGAGVLVFIAGLYSVFHIAGLTSIALAVLGGTGLAGIALGIAFRDITENFLASIFLSAQNPFRTGDLIEVGGIKGLVQRMTTRATVLMTAEGNHVQVPNSTIYKSNIINYTAHPNERLEFTLVIGLDESIAQVQQIAMAVLEHHPDVLESPAPWVLATEVRNAAVVMTVSFWFDMRKSSGPHVRSALIRLTKRGLVNAGVSMPAEQRHVVEISRSTEQRESGEVMTPAESGTEPEVSLLRRQGEQSEGPEQGKNLLDR